MASAGLCAVATLVYAISQAECKSFSEWRAEKRKTAGIEQTKGGRRESDGESDGTVYSTHSCVGLAPSLSWDREPPAQIGVSDGTCMFENICFLSGSFVYLKHPALAELELPVLHLNGRNDGPVFRIAVQDVYDEGLPARPGYKKGLTMYLHKYDFGGNKGHVLGDAIWQLVQGMVNFKVLTYDSRIYVDKWRRDEDGNLIMEEISVDQFRSVTGGPVLHISHLNSDQCFERFLVGWGGMAYGYGSSHSLPNSLKNSIPARGRGIVMTAWRDFLWHSLNVASPFAHRLSTALFNAMVIVKDNEKAQHPFAIGNPQAVSDHLASHFKIDTSLVVKWTGMPMEAQVRLLSQTNIVVSTPGSDIMPLIFLPDHSLLMLFCRWDPDDKSPTQNRTWEKISNEARLWLYHRAYLHVHDICNHSPSDVDYSAHFLTVRLESIDAALDMWLINQRLHHS